MNAMLEQINAAGGAFVNFAGPMMVQVSVLILIILVVDLLLKKKVRAVFRYWLWMLVLVKLVLPVTLSSPFSLGYLIGDQLNAQVNVEEPAAELGFTLQEPLAIEEIDSVPIVAPEAAEDFGPASAAGVGQPVAAVSPLRWEGVVFLVWAAVVVAMMLMLLQRAFFVFGLVAQAKKAGGTMGDVLERCREKMGMRGKIGLKLSANATSPAVCGLFRPVILVPQDLEARLDGSEMRAVLMHELAHIRRGDLWVNLAQTVLQIVYFYNPLLWIANAVIRRVREQAVDEAVLVAMGESARQYPRTLVNVAKLAFGRPALSLRLIGVVESKSALKGRVKRILERPLPKTAKLGIAGLIMVLLFGSILLPMAKFEPGLPELVIKGVVTDTGTDEPIAGAKVFDDGYGPEPDWSKIQPDERGEWGAITNSAGEYSFLTWPEHHSIKAEVPGYKAKKESLYSGHFTLNKKDEEIFDFELTRDKAAEQSEFKASLANGVTVELVGLGTAPWKTEQQWWKPDGTNLNQPALKFPYLFPWKDHPNGWQFVCTALCKYSNYTGKEISMPDAKFSNKELTRVWGTGFTTDGYKMIYIAYNPSIGTVPDKTDIRLAVGSKEFVQAKHLGNYTPKQHMRHYLEKNSDEIILHPVRIGSQGTPCVDLTCKQENKDIEFRVFAKLKSGETERWRGGDVGKDVLFFQSTPKRQNTMTIEDIEDIIIEFRPYEWLTFRKISLKPNFKTDVQIEVEKATIQSSVGGPNRRKVVGIGPGWWWLKRVIGDNYRGTIGGHGSGEKGVEYYNKVLSWAEPGGTFVMLFSFDEEQYSHNQGVPEGFEDLLPKPWSEIKKRVDSGETIELKGEARGLETIVLAAPTLDGLEELIKYSELLDAFRQPVGQVEGESDLEVLDIDFEPIHQGKNVVRVKVKNKSSEEQVFGIHIYTRSVDYGPQGVGWGRQFFDKIKAGETKTVNSPFHIQGPVTKNTWLRLKFYNPESIEAYDYEKPFQQKRFASGDLERQEVKATAEEINQLSKALEVIKGYIRDRQYKNAWQLFTEDYQQVQFGSEGLERFEQAMEPIHPIYSAFWWEREDFLSLKPLEAIYTDGRYKLTAGSVKGETWTIDFVKEDEVWRIDWIAGYRPGILGIQETDRFSELLDEPVSVDIDNSPDGDRLTIQYAVMAICEAAGVPYQWDKSAELADPQRRQYIKPVHIKDVPAKDALADILGPAGLSYGLDEDGLYLHKIDSEAKEAGKVGKADKLASENLMAEGWALWRFLLDFPTDFCYNTLSLSEDKRNTPAGHAKIINNP